MKTAWLVLTLATITAPSLARADEAPRLVLTLEKGDEPAKLVYQGMPALSADGNKVILPEPGFGGSNCHAGGNETHAVRVLPLAKAEKGGTLVMLKPGCQGDGGAEEVAEAWKQAVGRVKKLQAAIDAAGYHALATTPATGKVEQIAEGEADGPVSTNLPATAQLGDVKVTVGAPKGNRVTVRVEAKGAPPIDKKLRAGEGWATAGRVFVAPGARRIVFVELTWLLPREGMMKDSIGSTTWVVVPLAAPRPVAPKKP